ncbi:peptidylprolyl isomerase [bacterium]|nr:peptidylprolyl isomerase [bacterium]
MIKKLKFLIILIYFIASQAYALENKIILKVDNDIITSLDIFEEIKTLKFFNENLNQISNEEIYKIGLESLLNHKIKKNEVLVNFGNLNLKNEDYLKALIENTYKKKGYKNLREFKDILNNKGINFNYYEEKIKTNILWGQIVYSKYSNKIIVDENDLLEKIKNQKNLNRSFNLSEIVFQIENINELDTKYELIKSDIAKIGFENSILKYSLNNSSDNNGQLGWIDEKFINKNIQDQLDNIAIGAITKPIRIPSGFLILKKNDVKTIEQEIDIEEELKKLVNYERDKLLNNYSNIYFNKVKNNLNINAL